LELEGLVPTKSAKSNRKWTALAAAMLLGGLGLTNGQTQKSAARANLTGRVEMDDGQPAQATILIDSARPKTGTSVFCPSCYADCRKKAKTDTNGDFKIPSLDPELIFRVLIISDGCRPQFVNKVNPADGPLYAIMEKRDISHVPPANTVRGRVLDPKGGPIEGATVESHGVHDTGGSTMWGEKAGLDPLAVTDSKGEFILTSRQPFAALDVKAEAHGFASKIFTELAGGTNRHDLTVTEGATVTGRVVWNGQPLTNVSMGIVSVDRGMENFTGNFEIGTDADGRFTFANLPPNTQYNLYGMAQTMKKFGTAGLSEVSTGGDGSKTDVGDVKVTPGHRLAGRVVLDDGKPIPAQTRITVGLEQAWDSSEIMLDKEGRFEASNFPSGVVTLWVRISGYHLSMKNFSTDRMNYRLMGRLDRDITNLTVLLETGPQPEPDYNNLDLGDRPEQSPLAGIEGGGRREAAGRSWQISGHVVDGKTGKPVASFQLTPGNNVYSRVNLDLRNQIKGSNGVYAVQLNKRFADPVLKVEADGYLPIAIPPPQRDTTNFEITLQPGDGPSGVVLLPDGKPAAKASVGLVCADQQGLGLSGGDKITSWRNKSIVQTTDAQGHFAFRPELQMEDVAAASPAGFKLVSLTDLASNPKIILSAWGQIKGTLNRPTGPGTNEDLDLALAPEVLHSRWSFNLGNHAVTDEKGAFSFDHVPPAALELSYRVKMGGNFSGWRNVTLQTCTVTPGQTLELKIDAPKREEADRQFVRNIQRKPTRRVGSAVTGTVVSSDGKPASGAQVGLIVSNEYLALGKMTLHSGQDESLKTVTDADGRFTLPGVEGTGGVVAVHDSGFAHVPPPAGSNALSIKLEPWGEIHGTLRIGKRLGTNESVTLNSGGYGMLTYDFQEYKATTDDHGRFVITYAPPGEQYLSRQISMGRGSWTQGSITLVNVKAGGITEVTLGGTGRAVIGKARFTDGTTNADWKDVSIAMHESSPANSQWWATGKRPRFYYSEPSTNGAITFEDILPGKYQLTATVRRISDSSQSTYMSAAGSKEITVPDGSPDSKPFDAGTLDLHLPHPMSIGEQAKDFEVQTLEGKDVCLSDYRGKYVLLNFFYSQAATPESFSPLKEAFESYGKDKHLVMLGVSYGPMATLKDFAKTNNMKWTLATVARVANAMGALDLADYLQPNISWSDGITYLIDPEGKIIAKDLHGAELKSSLAKVLAKR
jgi:peroxiredoxin/uncharacterized GH25 family protein